MWAALNRSLVSACFLCGKPMACFVLSTTNTTHIAHLHLVKPQRRADSLVPLALARSKNLNGSTVSTAATASFQHVISPPCLFPRNWQLNTEYTVGGAESGAYQVHQRASYRRVLKQYSDHFRTPSWFSWSSTIAALPRKKAGLCCRLHALREGRRTRYTRMAHNVDYATHALLIRNAYIIGKVEDLVDRHAVEIYRYFSELPGCVRRWNAIVAAVPATVRQQTKKYTPTCVHTHVRQIKKRNRGRRFLFFGGRVMCCV